MTPDSSRPPLASGVYSLLLGAGALGAIVGVSLAAATLFHAKPFSGGAHPASRRPLLSVRGLGASETLPLRSRLVRGAGRDTVTSTCGTGWPAAAEAPPRQKIKMSLTASVRPSERIIGVFEVFTKHIRGVGPPPPPGPIWLVAIPGTKMLKLSVTNM
jgi:hypothetical protein